MSIVQNFLLYVSVGVVIVVVVVINASISIGEAGVIAAVITAVTERSSPARLFLSHLVHILINRNVI